MFRVGGGVAPSHTIMKESNPLFKKLSSSEEDEYKQWARDNYEPMTEIKGIWHPSVQAECVEMNKGTDPFGISPMLHDMVKEIFNRP